MKKLFINAKREGYSSSECNDTMTIKELISFLRDYDEDTLVYIKNDNGFTFGSISKRDLTYKG